MDSSHWLDNIRFQEQLTLDTYKICVKVTLGRFSTVERPSVEWPLFMSPEMTWGDFVYGISAEMLLAQARLNIVLILIYY